MRKAVLGVLTAAVLATIWSAQPAAAAWRDRYVVHGVEGDDLLKMRAGPGTGYVVIAGFPNGTVFRIHNCQQTGSTRWCQVSLDRVQGLKGYVSWAYLRKM